MQAVFVLSGRGTVRLGPHSFEVTPGCWITHLPGLANAAHQMSAGPEAVEYLCFSVAVPADVLGYPDSQKVVGETVLPGGAAPCFFSILTSTPTQPYYYGERSALSTGIPDMSGMPQATHITTHAHSLVFLQNA